MRDFIRHLAGETTKWHMMLLIAIGALVALFLLTIPSNYIVLALIGIFVLAIIVRKPEIGILVIVTLTSSIVFEESLPLIPFGPGSLQLTDILLLFMLGTIGYRLFVDKSLTFAKSPLNIPLLLFLGCAALSAALALVRYGVNFNDVMRLYRLINYYLLFFLVINLVTETAQLKFLIKGMFAIAAVVALAMIAQVIAGESVQLMPGRIESAVSIYRQYATLRILPPGQTLVFVSFITTICLIVFAKDTPVIFSWLFLLALLLGMGTLLTYTRSYWVAILIAAVILFLVTAAESRMRLATLLTVVLLLGGSVIVLVGGTEGTLGTTVSAVSDRFASLFAGRELSESSSLDFRRIENEYAVAQVKSHPILGIGLRNDYRPEIYGSEDKLTYYVHNSYLFLLTDMGLVGFLSFFWFYLRFLHRAITNWKRIADNFLKSALVGFMISGIVILPMALVIPLFMEWYSITVIAVMIGLSEAIITHSEMVEVEEIPIA